MGYRVLAEHVTCRTSNTMGIGTGGWMTVGVDRGRLLPGDAPVQDVAKLLRRGLIAPADGQEIPAEVAAAVAVLDAEAQARRAPVAVLTPRDRVANSLHYAAGGSPDHLAELLDAFEALVDERVAAALAGRSVDA
jgi:hypothetical protein